ncbi:putative reverse transcriptase domain-containing protein [Tanacetum coccineum]
MSSLSTVTYTSVYTNSEPGRVFWGADEELSDGGSPRVIVLFTPPSPVEASMWQTPSGMRIGEDPEEDYADYPADEGDGDDEPSDDDDDDDDDADDEDEEPFEDEDDDEEEEHLALATLWYERLSNLSHLCHHFLEARIAEYAATPTPPSPPPSPLLPWYEVGESSTAARRPTRGHRADYGFIGTMDAEIRRQRAEEDSYPGAGLPYCLTGVTDDDIDCTGFITTGTVVSDIGTDSGTLGLEIRAHARLIRGGLNNMPPRRTSAATTRAAVRAAAAAPMTAAAVEQLIEARVSVALVNHETLRNSTNGHGDRSHNSDTRIRGTVRTLLEPSKVLLHALFLGNALRWWNSHMKTVTQDVAYAMDWKALKNMMTVKYYPRGEIKKLEIKLWNLKVKGIDVISYTLHFQELALMCGRMFYEESEEVEKYVGGLSEVEKYVGGLPDMIRGNVMSYQPKTMEQEIEFANDQMDQKVLTISKRYAEQKRKLEFNARNNQGYQQQNKNTGCNKCKKIDHLARDCRTSGPNGNNNNCGNFGTTQNAVTCGNGNAPAKVYVVGNAGTNPDSNVITGTFLLNNRYASILFDTGADRSFVSTTFSSLIDITPTTLEHYYDVELADGKIIGINTIIWGCTLNFLNHPFNINLICIELGSFDVIIGHNVFLAHVTTKETEDKSGKKQLKDVPIVRDFPEVFPEELPGLPPTRQVEFQIDLMPGTAPRTRRNLKMHLKAILELLKKEELYAKFSKCEFWIPKLSPIKAKNFIVYCDASHKALGAVLMQYEKVIAYASRQLKIHEKNYTTHDLELGTMGKANVVADALSKKERIKLLRVQALMMTIGLDLPKQILNAQTEAHKPENLKNGIRQIQLTVQNGPRRQLRRSFRTSRECKPHVYQKKKELRRFKVVMSLDSKFGEELCLKVSPWKGVIPVPLEGLQVDDKLYFVEEPVEIMDREVKRLKQSRILIVKVRWNSRRGLEFTWEREDQFQKKYPHLFTKPIPSSSVAT